MADIIIYVFYAIGAGVVWLSKGCRTSYWDESGEHDTRNGILSILSILIILGLLGLAIWINN